MVKEFPSLLMLLRKEEPAAGSPPRPPVRTEVLPQTLANTALLSEAPSAAPGDLSFETQRDD